jgi:sulfur-carrier protein
MIMARILLFGRLTELAGVSEIDHPAGANLSQIVASLATEYPELVEALNDKTTRAALNLQLVPIGGDPVIGPNDELAFMPPVSGG